MISNILFPRNNFFNYSLVTTDCHKELLGKTVVEKVYNENKGGTHKSELQN